MSRLRWHSDPFQANWEDCDQNPTIAPLRPLPERFASFSLNLAGADGGMAVNISTYRGRIFLLGGAQLSRNPQKCVNSLQNRAGANMVNIANMTTFLVKQSFLLHAKLAIFLPNLAGVSMVTTASTSTSVALTHQL